ncbi:MAG: hypothetical protein CBD76_01910 [Pelagibacteraceae bacterium TMED216]|nr:MAG: hypothetical protein CBD76_01910 [Pelagibacteraceae bacterium TMED216]|tara:strand:+ start:8935 stop:9561 length:627 start_codon:yes stop_codon:yes gene_type:complete
MHDQDIKVLSIGNDEFNNSLEEIREDFKYNFTSKLENNKKISDYKISIIHEDFIKDNKNFELIKKNKNNKILLVKKKKNKNLPDTLQVLLPIKFRELNEIIVKTVTASQFIDNSKINIKKYILDKNERKLSKESSFIIITEKEVQLLELFLNLKKPLSKTEILKKVWGYSVDADTHTVETHIYRLRKKIKDKFEDDAFILNNENGYSI